MSIHPRKISIRKTINLQEFLRRCHDQIFIRFSFQIVTNLHEDVFVHKLWAEYTSCSAINSISMVSVCFASKIQEYSNYTAVVEITRGMIHFPLAGMNFPFAVPTSRARDSNTHLIRHFCIMLRNQV